MCDIAGRLSTLSWLGLIALVMVVRGEVRAVHRIPPSCCGPCDDVVCACCCWPFATCQLFRHLGFVEGTRYKFFSTSGALVEPFVMLFLVSHLKTLT